MEEGSIRESWESGLRKTERGGQILVAMCQYHPHTPPLPCQRSPIFGPMHACPRKTTRSTEKDKGWTVNPSFVLICCSQMSNKSNKSNEGEARRGREWNGIVCAFGSPQER